MNAFIIPLHVVTCLVLIVVVLLQSGKGADMGAAFGGAGSTQFGPGGNANILTRITTIAAITFMGTSLTLALLSAQQTSLFDGTAEPAVPAPPIAAPSAPIAAPSAPIAAGAPEGVDVRIVDQNGNAQPAAAPEAAPLDDAAPADLVPDAAPADVPAADPGALAPQAAAVVDEAEAAAEAVADDIAAIAAEAEAAIEGLAADTAAEADAVLDEIAPAAAEGDAEAPEVAPAE